MSHATRLSVLLALAFLPFLLAGSCKKQPPRTPENVTGDRAPARSGVDEAEGDEDGPLSAQLRDVLFDFDRSDIRQDQRPVLEQNAALLRTHLYARVVVEGHADERGSVEYNLALGERRARATHGYLVSLGIPAERLSTVSYGKELPADPGHDEAAWARNRRAHFVATK